MTRAEYEKKYGIQNSGKNTIEQRLLNVLGDKYAIEKPQIQRFNEVPVTQDEQIQATRDIYAGQQPTTPTLQQPITNLQTERFPDQNASSLDYAKQQGTVLPAYNRLEAKQAATTQNKSDFMAGLRSGWESTKQLGAGAAALVGDVTGSEGLRQWGVKKYKEYEKTLEDINKGANVTDIGQVKSVGNAIDYAQYQLGNIAPSMLESFGAMAIGAMAGTAAEPGLGTVAGGAAGFFGKSLVKKALKEEIENQLKKVVTSGVKGITSREVEALAKRELSKKIGIGVATIGNSYALALGDIYGETMDESGKGNATAALIGGLPYAAIDSIADMSLVKNIAKGGVGETALKRFTKAMASGAGKGGFNEAFQEGTLMLSGLASGKTYSKEEVLSRLGNSFAAGSIGGASFGAAGGIKLKPQESVGTNLPAPESRLSLPAGQQKVIIPPSSTPIGTRGETIYQPERVLPELPAGRTTGTRETAPLNTGFTMEELTPTNYTKSGKKSAVQPSRASTVIYGPIIEPNNFTKVAETVQEIRENKPEIVKQLVANGETKQNAETIVSSSIALLKNPETIDNGTTVEQEQSTGLDKIAQTGVVKTIKATKQIRGGKPVIEGQVILTPVKNQQKTTQSIRQEMVDFQPKFILETKNEKGRVIGKQTFSTLAEAQSEIIPTEIQTIETKPQETEQEQRQRIEAERVNKLKKARRIDLIKQHENASNNKKSLSAKELSKIYAEAMSQEGLKGKDSKGFGQYESRDVASGVLAEQRYKYKQYKKNKNDLVKKEAEKKRIATEKKSVEEQKTRDEIKKARTETASIESVHGDEVEAKKIVKAYNKLRNNDNPTDDDFRAMSEMEGKYFELTGKELYLEDVYGDDNIESASVARNPNEIEAILDQMEKQDHRKRGNRKLGIRFRKRYNKLFKKTQLGEESTRYVGDLDEEVKMIDGNKKLFSIANEVIKIANYFDAVLTRTLPGAEGFSFKNIIGIDSKNNPLVFSHEMTHYIVGTEKGFVFNLAEIGENKKELRNSYYRFYPGASESIKGTSLEIVYDEGLAEFIRYSLKDPISAKNEYPSLYKSIIENTTAKDGSAIDGLRKLHSMVNRIIYIYQNIKNPENIKAAKSVTILEEIPTEIKSPLLSSWGRAENRFSNSDYSFKKIDEETQNSYLDKNLTNFFVVDENGDSVELQSSMFGPSIKLAISGIKSGEKTTKILSYKGDEIKTLLSYGIGDFQRKLSKDKIYAKNFGALVESLDSQRNREKLQDTINKLESLKFDLEITEGKTKKAKIESAIESTKNEIVRQTNIVENEGSTDEVEKEIIKKFGESMKEDVEKLTEFHEAMLQLLTDVGLISKEGQVEMNSRSGYVTRHKLITDGLENFYTKSGRSARTTTMIARSGSSEATINPAINILNVYIETLKKYHEQKFNNVLYNKMHRIGLAFDLGESIKNVPGERIYAENGKTIRFKVLDDSVNESIDARFGLSGFSNKTVDALYEWIIKKPTKIAQSLKTGLNLFFFPKNMIVDSITSSFLTKTGYKPFYSQIQRKMGLGKYRGRSEEVVKFIDEYSHMADDYQIMGEIGGVDVNPYSIIDVINKEEQGIYKALDKSKRTLGFSEKFTRQEEYIRARLAGDTVSEAYQKSQKVSLKFNEIGTALKRVNYLSLFLNAGTKVLFSTIETVKDPKARRLLYGVMLSQSIPQFLAIEMMVRAVEDAKDEDEKEKKMLELFKYLESSINEKISYIPIGGGIKIPTLSFVSWPGVEMGLTRVKDVIPNYEAPYGKIAAMGLLSPLPGQIQPTMEGGSISEILGAKIFGFNVLSTLAMNLFGGKATYPYLRDIEGDRFNGTETNKKFTQETNSFAILLGQYLPKSLGISPVEIETAMKTATGQTVMALTDAAGYAAMSEEERNALKLLEKDYSELLLKKQLKSSFTTKDMVLSGSIIDSLYRKDDSINEKITELESKYDSVLNKGGTRFHKTLDDVDTLGIYNSDLPVEQKREAIKIKKEFEKIKKEQKDIRIVKEAATVAKRYTQNGSIPERYINSIYRYSLLVGKGQESKRSDDDANRITELNKLYRGLNTEKPKEKWDN